MKILIAGATGFVGSHLVPALLDRGDTVLVLTRSKNPEQKERRVRFINWKPSDEKSIVKEVDGVDVVINLAGESVQGRWTDKRKRNIMKSRINATRIIEQSIREATVKPKAWINASAVGFYGPRGNEVLSEDSLGGRGFLAEVCKAWESHAVRAEDFNVRVVRLRTGMVLGKNEGALKAMLPPFKAGLGGWFGSGNQWMSWIHIDDLVRLIIYSVDHETMRGAVNAVSPLPVTNKAFSMVLSQTLQRPCLFPIPGFLLRIMAGEMAQMLLTGQRVVPRKAEEDGFSFKFPELRRALEDLLA